MRIITLTKPYFTAAAKRLASQLRLSDAIGRVSHALKKQGDAALAEAVTTALASVKDNPMDRRRAEEHTSRLLTGETAPVLHAKLKNAPDNRSIDEGDIARMQAYMMSRYSYARLQRRLVTDLLRDLAAAAKEGHVHPFDAMAPMTRERDVFASLLHALGSPDDIAVTVSGFDEPESYSYGNHRYRTAITFHGQIDLTIERDEIKNEYEGRYAESVSVSVDGNDIEEYLDVDPDAKGDYLVDRVSDRFFNNWVDNQNMEMEPDVMPPNDPDTLAAKDVLLQFLAQENENAGEPSCVRMLHRG